MHRLDLLACSLARTHSQSRRVNGYILYSCQCWPNGENRMCSSIYIVLNTTHIRRTSHIIDEIRFDETQFVCLPIRRAHRIFSNALWLSDDIQSRHLYYYHIRIRTKYNFQLWTFCSSFSLSVCLPIYPFRFDFLSRLPLSLPYSHTSTVLSDVYYFM